MITRIREVRRARGMTLDEVGRACDPPTHRFDAAFAVFRIFLDQRLAADVLLRDKGGKLDFHAPSSNGNSECRRSPALLVYTV